MGGFRPSYFYIIRTFYHKNDKVLLSLFSVNLLSAKFSLELHMNNVQKLLSTTVPSLFIITFKVSLSFFNPI